MASKGRMTTRSSVGPTASESQARECAQLIAAARIAKADELLAVATGKTGVLVANLVD